MILFMGVAGSGKSTQGRRLADERGLPWLSTGEFLRMLLAGNKRIEMVKGKLLGDQEIIAIVQKVFNLVDTSNEFVLDGFPRTSAQADWLLNQVRHGQLSITAVVHMVASEKVVESRLLTRGRLDDTHEAIQERFDEYERQLKPILDQFKAAGIPIIEVDADKDSDAVYASLTAALAAQV